MDNKKTMYVVSHSHWDREWYLSHAKHNANLVWFMDRLIGVLENDEEFKTFHLDGQIILLNDYLAVRPSMEGRIKALIEKGKLKIGPFYILQDDYLISGEANVRNVLIGLRECEKYGKPTMIGYFPDTFGNVGQMPQILRGFDIDNAFMGRGTVISDLSKMGKTEDGFSEYKWVAPDGSQVITEQFVLWYGNGMELPEDKNELKNRLDAILNRMAPCTKTPYVLLLNGCDHQPVQANLSKVLENAIELGYDIKHTTLEDFLNSIRPYEDSFAPVKGEICQEDSNGFRTLRETSSARIYLKQQSYKAEYLLGSIVEPLSVIADNYGIKYDEEFIYYLWKGLLENYPHDSICGCSVDEVHTKMEVRFNDSIDYSTSVIERLGKKLVEKLAGKEKSVIVVNTYPKQTTETVKCVVDFRENEEIPENPILVDCNGNEYYPVVQDLGEKCVYLLPEDKFREVFNVRRFVYEIRGQFKPSSCTVLTIKSGNKSINGNVRCANNEMENEFIKVSFNANGTFNVLDKQSGKVLKNQNSFTEVGDKGNEYEFMPTGEYFDTLNDKAEISFKEVTLNKAVYKVVNRLMQQNGEFVVIESEVTLRSGKKNVEVAVKFVNKCKDHRVRAQFDWDYDYPTHISSGQFDLTERNNNAGAQWIAPHHPQRTYEFVERLSDCGDGSIIALRGNNEYEVVKETGRTQITLVRGVGILGDWYDFYTYDSQCLREITAEYSVGFYVNGEREKAIEEANMFHKPRLLAFAGNGKGENENGSIISVDGDVTITCLKQSRNGENVLRLFNPYCENKTVKFSKEVVIANMNEETVGGKVTEIDVSAKKIVTVKF